MARPDLYDPKLNRAYAELARHYGALIDPARAGRRTSRPSRRCSGTSGPASSPAGTGPAWRQCKRRGDLVLRGGRPAAAVHPAISQLLRHAQQRTTAIYANPRELHRMREVRVFCRMRGRVRPSWRATRHAAWPVVIVLSCR